MTFFPDDNFLKTGWVRVNLDEPETWEDQLSQGARCSKVEIVSYERSQSFTAEHGRKLLLLVKSLQVQHLRYGSTDPRSSVVSIRAIVTRVVQWYGFFSQYLVDEVLSKLPDDVSLYIW